MSNNTRLNEKAQAVVSQCQQVEAQLHLSLESLHFDEAEAKKISFCKLNSVFSFFSLSLSLSFFSVSFLPKIHYFQYSI